MKEIVIISGKGGTGKTSISASFGYLGGKELVIGDCDVDAADMHLIMAPDYFHKEQFFSESIAEIETDKCSSCGICSDVCRFNAIKINQIGYTINTINCEGCGYCSRVCPENAIIMKERLAGDFFISKTRIGSFLVHAKLGIGADNSGKLVAKVKKEAKRLSLEKDIPYIIIDGAPGVGCPVISSLSGADYVILITEPTISGLHDLGRIYELVKKFGIPAGCIINKYDINLNMTMKIESYLTEQNILHLCNLPYNDNFTKAMIEGKTIIEYDKDIILDLLKYSWERIRKILEN